MSARILITLGAALSLVACQAAPQRVITSQASYGHDLPIAAPVPTEGLDEPDGPMLNANGGEVPRGVYTAPVEQSGLGDPIAPEAPRGG